MENCYRQSAFVFLDVFLGLGNFSFIGCPLLAIASLTGQLTDECTAYMLLSMHIAPPQTIWFYFQILISCFFWIAFLVLCKQQIEIMVFLLFDVIKMLIAFWTYLRAYCKIRAEGKWVESEVRETPVGSLKYVPDIGYAIVFNDGGTEKMVKMLDSEAMIAMLAFKTPNGKVLRDEMAIPKKKPIETDKSPKGLVALASGKEIIGMGFRYGDELLTASHVFKGCQSTGLILVNPATGSRYTLFDPVIPGDEKSPNVEVKQYGTLRDGTLKSAAAELDLCGICVSPQVWSALGVGSVKIKEPTPETSFTTYGFIKGKLHMSVGVVSADKRRGFVKHDAWTQEGWSGSPMYNGGQVICIHAKADYAEVSNIAVPLIPFYPRIVDETTAPTQRFDWEWNDKREKYNELRDSEVEDKVFTKPKRKDLYTSATPTTFKGPAWADMEGFIKDENYKTSEQTKATKEGFQREPGKAPEKNFSPLKRHTAVFTECSVNTPLKEATSKSPPELNLEASVKQQEFGSIQNPKKKRVRRKKHGNLGKSPA